MQTTAQLWAPIVKMVKNDDGTLLVEGPISDAGLDRDRQKCDQAWLDRAVPAWFAEGGNVREQHSSIAAGTAVEHGRLDDGTHTIKALVVDPTSVLKCEKNVLRGFSIGIKNARVTKGDASAPNGHIVDGNIIEVSLVDRPANPRAMLQLAKADSAGEQAPVEQAFVEVEETPAATATTVLEQLKALGVDMAKADDESSDITGAQQAIAIIARLIQSEADGLAAGDLSEAADVSTLLEAVSALRWFISREQAEQSQGSDVFLADAADAGTVKAEDPAPAATTEPAKPVAPVVPAQDTPDTSAVATDPEPATESATEPSDPTSDSTKAEQVDGDGATVLSSLTKAQTDAVTEMIEAALTKANQVHEAAVDKLRTELAEVKSQPSPGGPIRVRAAADAAKADAATKRTTHLAKAAEFLSKADTAPDRETAAGYRELADKERAAADALTTA